MQGENPLPEAVIEKYAKTSGEICKDVFLLNKSGIMTTAHGLRIGCLGGIYNPGIYSSAESPPGFASPFFTTHTIERLLSNTLIKLTTQSKGHNYGSLAAIRNSASTSQLIDILITNDWPASIAQLTTTPLPAPELSSIGAPPLDDVIRKVKPRYHFAAGGGYPPKFWEREPFVWDDEQGRTSRFWFYAFSIAPSTPEAVPPARPANATKNPFTEVISRPLKRPLEASEGQNFIWGNVSQGAGKRTRTSIFSLFSNMPHQMGNRLLDISVVGVNQQSTLSTTVLNALSLQKDTSAKFATTPVLNAPIKPGHLVRDCPTRHAVGDTGGPNQRPSHGERGRRAPPKEIGPDECWFCLSNPNLAKHLIVSIGTECYVTLPKGQIIPTQSAADHGNIFTVPGGGHVLIIPIAHHPTFTTIPSDIAPPIIDETIKYKTALQALYAKHGAAPVFFEVGRLSAKGGHAHIQAIPVPVALQHKVEDTFLKEGRTQGIDFESDADGALDACAGGARSYFRVDLPDGRKLVHLMKDHVPFSIQFGRQVLVSLLNTPERFDWKSCVLPENEDKADVQAFKSAFAPFDPSL
ncbi:CwfJ C-terminus 1-domain-containing protein-like protein [Hygrophoropsis aurantiaca]|uniref:CwfJ C-terminus 1-domain-containing protein-like protein n=1 Tax=Hygrophoropsis aurantiaca TaxID=72124 RepID=A0ACB8ADS5_9AGAM|nr:CwfJ C-terminus 1-domain-containing protein-like protein [Hygrophoropsis aurantiaca]